jgi:hypothetical protein
MDGYIFENEGRSQQPKSIKHEEREKLRVCVLVCVCKMPQLVSSWWILLMETRENHLK